MTGFIRAEAVVQACHAAAVAQAIHTHLDHDPIQIPQAKDLISDLDATVKELTRLLYLLQ